MGEIFAGRYELVDPIGRGGVGAVWRSWDHRRARYVAAKVLQQSDAHTLLRFVREQALRIDHPHVLAPASWAADDDKVLFTMDLVRGGSLAHLIGDYGPLPPSYVCTLLDQLLSGVEAVHREGVIHRDIKPANVLLEATGTGRPHVRLSDFGIAMTKGEPRLTDTNFVVGTPGYFAPEQILGAEPDFPADLFTVGLVALYLLSGRKPDAEALIERFTEHGVPNAPDGIPEPLWQVIANLLLPDPEARFRTANGARKALLSAMELLPEPDFDDEAVEVFDHLGPLPPGFGPDGPTAPTPIPRGARLVQHTDPHALAEAYDAYGAYDRPAQPDATETYATGPYATGPYPAGRYPGAGQQEQQGEQNQQGGPGPGIAASEPAANGSTANDPAAHQGPVGRIPASASARHEPRGDGPAGDGTSDSPAADQAGDPAGSPAADRAADQPGDQAGERPGVRAAGGAGARAGRAPAEPVAGRTPSAPPTEHAQGPGPYPAGPHATGAEPTGTHTTTDSWFGLPRGSWQGPATPPAPTPGPAKPTDPAPGAAPGTESTPPQPPATGAARPAYDTAHGPSRGAYAAYGTTAAPSPATDASAPADAGGGTTPHPAPDAASGPPGSAPPLSTPHTPAHPEQGQRQGQAHSAGRDLAAGGPEVDTGSLPGPPTATEAEPAMSQTGSFPLAPPQPAPEPPAPAPAPVPAPTEPAHPDPASAPDQGPAATDPAPGPPDATPSAPSHTPLPPAATRADPTPPAPPRPTPPWPPDATPTPTPLAPTALPPLPSEPTPTPLAPPYAGTPPQAPGAYVGAPPSNVSDGPHAQATPHLPPAQQPPYQAAYGYPQGPHTTPTPTPTPPTLPYPAAQSPGPQGAGHATAYPQGSPLPPYGPHTPAPPPAYPSSAVKAAHADTDSTAVVRPASAPGTPITAPPPDPSATAPLPTPTGPATRPVAHPGPVTPGPAGEAPGPSGPPGPPGPPGQGGAATSATRPVAPPAATHAAPRPAGPSRAVTLAILVAAALCFAVGTWALLAS